MYIFVDMPSYTSHCMTVFSSLFPYSLHFFSEILCLIKCIIFILNVANSRMVNGSYLKNKKLKRNCDVPVSCFCVALFLNSFWYHIFFLCSCICILFLIIASVGFVRKKKKERIVSKREYEKLIIGHWFCVVPCHCTMYGANQRICVSHIRHSGRWRKKTRLRQA